MGICNGFQVLVESGLLPGALLRNRELKFVCRPVTLRVETTNTPFTAAAPRGNCSRFRWRTARAAISLTTPRSRMLRHDDRVVLRYVDNPNGSLDDIAGICSEKRNVMGMMPHPERAADALLGCDRRQSDSGIYDSFVVGCRCMSDLTPSELDKVRSILKREPNETETGIFTVMWSEHCSYKSSRIHLKKLPTKSDRVLVGPGENAGIIDIGDGYAIAFKIESHNHPSFIEPFQGAATGVGGILRDIFTMGARPIAVMDALRFGPLDDPEWGDRNKRILEGVVGGISHYGNCFGVPTVGGETVFESCYNGNPLVNVFALGVFRHDEIFFGRATGVGNPVIYVGAKTGRDGIKGASMASAEFDEDSKDKRPNVQVGDPFMEKLLLEACLEAMRTGRDRRHSGYGRGGADLLHLRDGQPRGDGH